VDDHRDRRGKQAVKQDWLEEGQGRKRWRNQMPDARKQRPETRLEAKEGVRGELLSLSGGQCFSF
jgi:hypothetical protein